MTRSQNQILKSGFLGAPCPSRGHWLLVAGFFAAAAVFAEESGKGSVPAPPPDKSLIEPAPKPIEPLPVTNSVPLKVNWTGVLTQSLSFLAVEHGFRLLTEAGTRDGMHKPLKGYKDSITNLHGWADGDEFYVNYVGHPMQGAVAGFIWTQNDRKYLDVEFGRDRRYWNSRMRAGAFALAYSVQFEIGPLSESSVGAIQARFPQQGFVDLVVTPAIGFAWMLAEDSIDKYIIKRFEARINNPWGKMFLRSGLNPARCMGNALGGRVPWERDTRRGVFSETEAHFRQRSGPTGLGLPVREPPPGVAPFEFSVAPTFRKFTGPVANGGLCVGGGTSGAFRLASQWQLVANVDGCKMTGLAQDVSGDSLSYLIGPRWSPLASRRWNPYVQFLVGGQKLTQEIMFPGQKLALEQTARQNGLPVPLHEEYTREVDTNGLSMAVGAGLDLKVNSAIALRVAGVDYTSSRVNALGGANYKKSLQFTTGLIVRFGTW